MLSNTLEEHELPVGGKYTREVFTIDNCHVDLPQIIWVIQYSVNAKGMLSNAAHRNKKN